MDPFQLLANDEFSVVRSLINKTVIHDYGIISRDMGDGYVEVLSVQRKCGSVQRIACKYLTISSSMLSVSLPPTVGDLVMVIALQHRDDKMFTEGSPVDVYIPTGYSYDSCIAIPIGVFKEDAANRVSVTEDGVAVEVTESLSVTAKGVSISSEENAAIDAAEIHLNGSSKSLVTHAELDAALSSYVTQIGLTLASGSNGGGPVVFAVAPPSSIDISGAATSTVKTGG